MVTACNRVFCQSRCAPSARFKTAGNCHGKVHYPPVQRCHVFIGPGSLKSRRPRVLILGNLVGKFLHMQ